jgi:hypothetical protein
MDLLHLSQPLEPVVANFTFQKAAQSAAFAGKSDSCKDLITSTEVTVNMPIGMRQRRVERIGSQKTAFEHQLVKEFLEAAIRVFKT